MTTVKYIIFDFDGTLVDTTPLIVATMQAAISELGLPPKSDRECKSSIGLRLEDIPAALWPDHPEARTLYPQTYRRIFDEKKGELQAKAFPGVIETLHSLHADGYRLAIASSRSHKSLTDYVALFGIADLFDAIVGGDDVSNGKPAPDPVFAICGELGWDTAESLVVGDTCFDIEMGHNAGTQTCAVSYGNQTREELIPSHPDAVINSFAAIIPLLKGVSQDAIDYVEGNIIPRYATFDKAHREDHVRMVIGQSLHLAGKMHGLDPDLVYLTAAFHDLGLINGRENHHIDSASILASDPFITARFTPEQIKLMAEAAEDHRASGKSKPRSDYGLIVAEADRFIDAETIVRRTIQYGLANYPDLDREGHFRRTLDHLKDKYGPQGYLKIWIPWSDNARRLSHLHKIIADSGRLKEIFNRIFDEETSL